MGHLETERAPVLNHMSRLDLERVPDSNHVGHIELEHAPDSNHVSCLDLEQSQEPPPLPSNFYENHLERDQESEQENGGGSAVEEELKERRRREEGHELNTELRILITREIRKPGRRKCTCWGSFFNQMWNTQSKIEENLIFTCPKKSLP